MRFTRLLSTFFLLWAFLLPALAVAQGARPGESAEQKRAREFNEAFERARLTWHKGPSEITVINQGKLNLPAGYLFIPQAEASHIMRALGNIAQPSLVGLVISEADGLAWFAVLSHEKVGYIKDDDARSWNADELLSQLREGTEAANVERRERGFPPIEVAGWIEAPRYDETKRHLVWSALVRSKDAPRASVADVNYNTYALGREGYLQLNLVTGDNRIAKDKEHAARLLAALSYNQSKRYQDFNSATDPVAEYGLAALIAGAAAKKLGLLALIGVFLAKAWKLIAIGAIAAVAILRRFFSRPSPGA